MLPNPLKTANLWREEAQRLGVGEIFLATVEVMNEERADPTRLGIDAAVDPPVVIGQPSGPPTRVPP